MNYDLSITPEQLRAVAEWCASGPDIAPVQLALTGDRWLDAAQGDARESFDVAGNRASVHYPNRGRLIGHNRTR